MTRRLMFWLAGATILFWIVAAGFGVLIMREEFDEVFDSALQETAQRLMPLVVTDLSRQERSGGPRRMNDSGNGHAEYLTYQLRDKKGRVLLRSHDAPGEPFAVPLRRGFADTNRHRIYTEETPGGLFLQVADPLAQRREAMIESALSLALPLIALGPLSMAAIWIVVRRSLAPIKVLRGEIEARDSGNLSPMGMIGLPVELDAIAMSVDRLLERLRKSIDAEREFTANSAHELRTPIAGALAQTQRLIAELPDGPAKTRSRDIEASLTSLAHLAEKLLQLSRADSGIGASDRLLDLVPVVRMLVDEFNRRPDAAGRLLLGVETGSVMRKVDIDAFAIALRNLIENALIHSAPDTQISISIGNNGTVSVLNRGSAIPQDELEQLTTRFRRGATAAKGSGLGLAIAATLVRRMGGMLELRSPPAGREDGFQATMRFP
jgi:two-component system OmpR family sensor kinase